MRNLASRIERLEQRQPLTVDPEQQQRDRYVVTFTRALILDGDTTGAAAFLRWWLQDVIGTDDPFTIQGVGAALWGVLSAPDIPEDVLARLRDLCGDVRAIMDARGAGNWWGKRYMFIEAISVAADSDSDLKASALYKGVDHD